MAGSTGKFLIMGQSQAFGREAQSGSTRVKEALYKIRQVYSGLPQNIAFAELRKLFTPALNFLDLSQLEFEDPYFLRITIKLEALGLILRESNFTDEATKMALACSLLRKAYLEHYVKNAKAIDVCRVATEFTSIELPKNLISDNGAKKLQVLFLSTALCGTSYLQAGVENCFVEQLCSSPSLEDHYKFARNAYFCLDRVKYALEKLSQRERLEGNHYFDEVLRLLPGPNTPIAFDYRPFSKDTRSGLVGLATLARDIAWLKLTSEILRTHSSSRFIPLSTAISTMAINLIETLSSYCDSVGGVKISGNKILASAIELKKKFQAHYDNELSSKFEQLVHSHEYKPQLESIAMSLGIRMKAVAA